MFRLDGKIALITGSGGGLGVGVARALCSQGAHVVINDLNPELAEQTSTMLCAEGFASSAAPFDVTQRGAVKESVARIERDTGPIGILVNNAGNAGGQKYTPTPFVDMPPDLWERFIAVNMTGVMNCTQAVIGGMSARGYGRVITVSSTAGRVGKSINVSVYGAAKAGAAHFMRHLSQEVAKDGITANVISLGFMNTMSEGFAHKIIAQIPAGRVGMPEDLAAATVYLASDEAAWVTGATLVVDGGYTPF
ncbi:MAG: family oxidoreductase [Rhodospirillales bacterium]|nr:family oxidoreductase [Rhodospirillales bacterium]